MDPTREYQLRTRITAIISKAGQYLVRTHTFTPEFQKYGRWSRWGAGKYCFETHLDLEEFSRRIDCHDGIECKVYITRVRGWKNPSY